MLVACVAPSCRPLACLLQKLPLWADVLRQHQRSPFHALLAGGNQVVHDSVFAIPALQEWLLSNNQQVNHACSRQAEAGLVALLRQQLKPWWLGICAAKTTAGG